MAKLWPVLAIAAAAIVAVVLMLGGEDGAGYVDDDEIIGYDEQGNPILMTSDPSRRPKREPKPEPVKSEKARQPEGPIQVTFSTGAVLDAVSKAPIPGALIWAEPPGRRCPRLPSSKDDKAHAQTSSGKDGRFTLSMQGARNWAPHDLFASAKGYVVEVHCAQSQSSDVTFLMRRALQQKVRVTDLHSRPIAGAKLEITPADGTPALPGHAGYGRSDRNGDAEIDGLIPGEVMLEADHPLFMPTAVGPFDPATSDEIEIKLAPALRLTLVIRSDDGSDIKNPTLAWTTNGTPPHRGLKLLQTSPTNEDSRAEVKAVPVRIPCDHRTVQLEVKADGFEPWVPEAEPLPVEGGERELIASLRRDLSLGSLTVRFEDNAGNAVNYREMRPAPNITRLDRQPISGGIVLETAETLNFPAMPQGPYRIDVVSPGYAPASVEVTVRAGEKTEAVCRLEQPAKLKINFVASERVTVRFRLMKDGRIVPAFPEGQPPNPNESGTPPLAIQGNEGTVFTGLPSGPIVIRVTNADLVAAPRTVQLRAGETTETEIQVRFR